MGPLRQGEGYHGQQAVAHDVGRGNEVVAASPRVQEGERRRDEPRHRRGQVGEITVGKTCGVLICTLALSRATIRTKLRDLFYCCCAYREKWYSPSSPLCTDPCGLYTHSDRSRVRFDVWLWMVPRGLVNALRFYFSSFSFFLSALLILSFISFFFYFSSFFFLFFPLSFFSSFKNDAFTSDQLCHLDME